MTELTETDFTYAKRAEGDQILTVYRRPDVAPRAVLLYFHGGGWFGGARDVPNIKGRLHPLLDQGVVVVSASYRLTIDSVYPAQLEDAGDAFEWVAGEFAQFPIFISGSSAGGHLASLVGLGAWQALTGKIHARRAAGVVTYALVADPLAWDAERLKEPLPVEGTFAFQTYKRSGIWPPEGRGRRLLEGADARVSPVVFNHVGSDAVPFLILHGDRDTCVSYRQSVQLFDVLSHRHNAAYLLEIAGADHEDELFGVPTVLGAIAGFVTQFSSAAEK